ncbi:ABC-three component system middle component 7 [Acidaminococcus sp. HCP3S3_G9_1]|uniref:ABC-three component system middle component 7 n=1 Tax=Acidaminococcus sp. HCP3S3_G9_1 TaxID=3438732 RepID=UPI003F8FCEAA
MILPNKLFSYNESVLSKIPCVLSNLGSPKTPVELLRLCKNINGPVELVDVLDCLYALKRITLNDKGEIEKC